MLMQLLAIPHALPVAVGAAPARSWLETCLRVALDHGGRCSNRGMLFHTPKESGWQRSPGVFSKWRDNLAPLFSEQQAAQRHEQN